MSLSILHRRRFLDQITPVQSYIDTTGLIYGFSFRQLTPTSNLAIRQYSTDGSTFQDVGFSGGYIDTSAITSFAAGTKTSFEWYDQLTNTLKYVKYSTFARPVITDASGNLNQVGNKITSFNELFRLNIVGAGLPANSHTFQVAKGTGDAVGFAMLNSSSSSKWMGIMSNQTISATNMSGAHTYWKNGVQLTEPVTRLQLKNAVGVGTLSQHSVKNIPTSEFGTGHNLIKGYNVDGQFPPLNNTYEEIWGDASVMTAQQVIDLEQNQMAYYL